MTLLKPQLQRTRIISLFYAIFFILSSHIAAQEVMPGSISGQLSATPTGAATYTIPIECPKGVGMEPSLSLVYNSQSGKGLVGWGWNLAGLSCVLRSPKIAYHDGTNASITWTKNDPLSLNGQRLIKVAAGADTVAYRLENDPTTLVCAYGADSWGPTYLKAFTRDGLTMTYGSASAPSSYASAYSIANTQASPVKMGWNLVEVVDGNGNFMKIDYILSSGGYVGNVVSKITYGGNKRLGTTGNLVVSFDYELRPDEIRGYVAGKETLLQLRLKSIKTLVNNNEQKKYQLTYSSLPGDIMNTSSLVSVDLYNRGVKLVNPTTFTYGTKTISSEIVVDIDSLRFNSGNHKKRQNLFTIDSDGDGYMEIADCYERTDLGQSVLDVRRYEGGAWKKVQSIPIGVHDWWPEDSKEEEPNYIFGDFNGNSTTDYVYISHQGKISEGNTHRDIGIKITDGNGTSLYNNASFFSAKKPPFFSTGQLNGEPFTALFHILREYDRIAPTLYHYHYGALKGQGGALSGTGSQYFATPCEITGMKLVNFGGASNRDDLWLTLADGTNRIITNNLGIENWFSGNAAKTYSPGLNITKDDYCQFGDLNGDGLTDIIFRKDNAWKVAYNKGDYTFNVQTLGFIVNMKTVLRTPNEVKYKERDVLHLIDFNQDGLMDIVSGDEQLDYIIGIDKNGKQIYRYYFYRTSWVFYQNTGSSFQQVYSSISAFPAGASSFGDFFGNGRVCWTNARLSMTGTRSDTTLVIRDLNLAPNQNLMLSVTNPVSGTTNLEYKPYFNCNLTLSDPSPSYKVNSLNDYFNIGCIPIKSSLFRVFSGSNDGNTAISYKYGSPVVNWKYRGFMGFRYFEKKDVKTRFTELTEQYFPYSGRSYYIMQPYAKTVYVGNNRSDSIVSREQYDYNIVTYPGKRVSTQLKSLIHSEYLAGGKSYTQYYDSLDTFNNPITVRTVGALQSERHDFKYGKHGAWCVNKVTEDKATFSCSTDNTSLVRTSLFTYNPLGNLTESKMDNGDVNMKTTRYPDLDYDKYGHPLKIVESARYGSRTTKLAYTSCGRFIASQTNPLNETVTYVWDEDKGLLKNTTDRMGTTTYSHHYTFDLITSIKYPNAVTETQALEWSPYSDGTRYYTVQTLPDKPGRQFWTYYDKYGRELRSSTHNRSSSSSRQTDAAVTSTRYTPEGRIAEHLAPGQNEVEITTHKYTYDGYGRIIKDVTPEGDFTVSYGSNYKIETTPTSTIRTEWNSDGLVAKTTTNGKSVQFVYTAASRLKSSTPDNGGTVSMEYDLQGNRSKLVDPDAGTTWFQYDGWGQLLSQRQQVHKSGGETATYYSYTNEGLLEYKTCGNEPTHFYEYDRYNRLKKIDTYDVHSRSWEYNIYDQVTKVTDQVKGKTFVARKEYDTYGRLKKDIYPSGYYVNYNYDINNHLTSVTDTLNRVIWEQVNAYRNGLIQKEKKNGVITEYLYTPSNQVTDIKAPGIVDMRYTYYPNGNVKTFADELTNQKDTYTYDNLDRLVSWKDANNYPFDNIEYSTSGVNRISWMYDYIGWSSTLTYNSATSNKVSSAISRNGAQDITYTEFKKVKTLQKTGTTESFNIDYGVDDQRVFMHIQTRDNIDRYYLDNYEEEYTAGTVSRIHYIYGGNGLAAVYKETGNNKKLYSAYTDRQGSLMALAEGSVLRQRYSYTPFGARRNPVNWMEPDANAPYIVSRGYTMHEHLDLFDLINMNGRVYEPSTGLFLSPDPYIQDPTNWLNHNRYAYCLNNPLKYVDPDGEFWWTVPAITAALFAIGNTTAHAIRGDIKNIGDGLKYFGQGAIAGAALGLTMQYAPCIPVIGGVVDAAMTGYLYAQAATTLVGVAAGLVTGRIDNSLEIFLGNFYLDENSFGNGIIKGYSRHTWEMVQTFAGHLFSHIKNATHDGVRVDYLGGATFVTHENANVNTGKGVTLGSFVNIDIPGKIEGNFDDYAITDPLFMHEYGHTIQSRIWGPAYIAPAALSAFSAAGSEVPISGSDNYPHDVYWTEIWANKYAAGYFKTHYNVNWDFARYPLKTTRRR